MTIALLMIGGTVFLLIGGEALVRGAAQTALRLNVSPLVAGIVIAGFGTSMPELVVSVRAALAGAPALAAGNVIGSNISNTLLILPVAALIRPIAGPGGRLTPDGYVLMAVSVGVLLLALQPRIPAWQGALMLLLLIGILVAKYRHERWQDSGPGPAPAEAENPPAASVPMTRSLLAIAVGLVALPVGAELLVDGAVRLADQLGISKGLVGLTIVAVGTSLPELATSAIAAVRGQSDIAYGNVLGSNLFNLLGILGVTAVAAPLIVPPVMVYVDGVVMVAAAAVMLWFVASGARLTRLEAAIMLAAYLAYVAARYSFALV